MENKDSVVDTVQVVLRIRPLVQSEVERGCDECVEVVPGEPQVQIRDLAFTYNYVFPPHIGQQEFYDTAIKNLVNKLFDGYNVTILAYGQTGSGKTYSMGTNYTGCEGDSNNLGVIPQAVGDIFDYVEGHEEKFVFKVSVSFMELYQEQCYDLLSGKQRNHSVVEIREDNRGVILPGLTELEVNSASETMMCLMRGSEGRAVGATAMNAFSSRSHAVFTIYISKESITDKNQATTSKFHLVDLAGSERTKKTKATGDRLKEGIKINQGLLALGNVISALGDGTNRGYICYRESKLTRLLQDSLGGNSLTLMVACVSPADYNLEETVSTLRYADRARRIRNKPIVNQDAKAAEIIRLNNLVNELRLQLLGKAPIKSESSDCSEELEKERVKYNELLSKHKQLTEMLTAMIQVNSSNLEKLQLAENAKDNLERKLTELMDKCNKTIENVNLTYEKSDDGDHKQLIDDLEDMKCKLGDLQSETTKYHDQLLEHDIRGSNGVKLEDNDSLGDIREEDEDQAMIQNEAHAMGQVALNKQFNELNQELVIKAALMKQILTNNQELPFNSETLRENENRIAALEKEKNELTQQLKNAQSKHPLTEERRSKVQALEQEIQELRKRCQHQANLVRIKERNEAKIKALNTEIQNMKVAKVNLVKRMRVESERFRRWKAESERDVCRLRAADRKRATAMAKMETMHVKQQNVLKRKMEETVAVNRRLKEALERQKSSQLKRAKGSKQTEAVQQFLEQELEIQLSTVEAQRTLDELMDDRRIIKEELERLKSDTDESEGNTRKIQELEDQLQLRKAQMSDLQQKIITADQENNARTRWDNVQTMIDAKSALKYLFEVLVESKKEQQLYAVKNKPLEIKYQQIQEEYEAIVKRLERCEKEFAKKMAFQEMQHEQKVSALMGLSSGIPATGDGSDACKTLQGHINLQRDRIDKLEADNERLQKELEHLQSMGPPRKTQSRPKVAVADKPESDFQTPQKKYVVPSEDEDSINSDSEKDPDWRATPVYKRLRAQRSRLTVNLSENNLDTTSTLYRAGVKRGSDGAVHCSCRGSCDKRLCRCRKADVGCSDLCKCPSVLCKNRRNSEETDDKENTPVSEEEQSTSVPDRPSFFEAKTHCGADERTPQWLLGLLVYHACIAPAFSNCADNILQYGYDVANYNVFSRLLKYLPIHDSCIIKRISDRMGHNDVGNVACLVTQSDNSSLVKSREQSDGTFVKKKKYFFYPPGQEIDNASK